MADLSHSHIGYTPFPNGSDSNFTHPLELTVVNGGKVGKQLELQPLNLLTGGFIANEQMWTLNFGVEV